MFLPQHGIFLLVSVVKVKCTFFIRLSDAGAADLTFFALPGCYFAINYHDQIFQDVVIGDEFLAVVE